MSDNPPVFDPTDKLRSVHHFVPQSYLKRFARIDKPSQIYTYEISRKPYSTNIENIAGQRDFYTYRDATTEKETAALENVFADIDDKGARILNSLDDMEDGFVELPEEKKADLFYYIAHLHTRNLQQRKQLAQMYEQMSLVQMQAFASDKDSFHQQSKSAPDGIYTYELAEKARQSLLNGDLGVDIDPMSEHFIGATLENAQDLYFILMKFKRLALLSIVSGPRHFVTSDNPVTHYLENEDPRRKMGVGYINAIFQLPISPTRCLLLIDDQYVIDEFGCDERHVDHMNFYTYRYADRWIFSHESSSKVSDMFNTHKAKEPLTKLTTIFDN